jgi:type IV pilus assembly protein PilE
VTAPSGAALFLPLALQERLLMNKALQRGFNLTELLIVIVIVSILAAVAYPAYTRQILKGNRASMQADMQDFAVTAEQWRAQHFSYEDIDTNFATLSPVLDASPLYNVVVVPDSTDGYQSYTLTATPIGKQSVDGTLILNSVGQSCFVEGATTCDVTDPAESWSH